MGFWTILFSIVLLATLGVDFWVTKRRVLKYGFEVELGISRIGMEKFGINKGLTLYLLAPNIAFLVVTAYYMFPVLAFYSGMRFGVMLVQLGSVLLEEKQI